MVTKDGAQQVESHSAVNGNPERHSAPKENLWISLLFNVAIPILILSKMSSVLGALNALLAALFFPFAYALYDFYKRRQANPISILGFSSTLIKGLFAFYQVDGFWFAVQEAAIPTFLGVFTIGSVWIKRPLVNYFLYNESVFNVELLNEKLAQNHAEEQFKRLVWQVTLVFGFAFFLGGALNYILAIRIIVSRAGTEAFNQELAKMTMLSYVVIVLPKLLITVSGMWWFIHKLKKLTGLQLENILRNQ